MEIISCVVSFFVGVVTMLCVLWIFIPVTDALLYGLGYTIFNILCTNRKKAMNSPQRYIIIVIKWYLDGFGDRLFCGANGTHTIGRTVWKPYFHYKK